MTQSFYLSDVELSIAAHCAAHCAHCGAQIQRSFCQELQCVEMVMDWIAI